MYFQVQDETCGGFLFRSDMDVEKKKNICKFYGVSGSDSNLVDLRGGVFLSISALADFTHVCPDLGPVF